MTRRAPARTGPAAPAGVGPVVSSAHLAAGLMPALSELEFGLILLGHAFNRWMVRCAAAAGIPDLSALDVLVLHTVNHRNRGKTLADICLVLAVEDTHLVTYAVKKLQGHGLVASGRQGKEKTVTITPGGRPCAGNTAKSARRCWCARCAAPAPTSASCRSLLARCVLCRGTTIRRRVRPRVCREQDFHDGSRVRDRSVTGMIRGALDRLYLYSGYLAGAFMVAIFVLMMALSAGRPLGLNIPAADDFVSWCMAAMAFLGLAHTFRNGEMIRVGLLIDKLPEKSRHWIELACLVIGIGFIAFFALYAIQLVRDSWRFHEMSQGVIAIPMWIPQIGYAPGLVILLIAFVDEFVHVLRGNLPRYEKPKPHDRRRGGRARRAERGVSMDCLHGRFVVAAPDPRVASRHSAARPQSGV